MSAEVAKLRSRFPLLRTGRFSTAEVFFSKCFIFFLENTIFYFFFQDSVVLSRLRALARGCGLDAKGCADMTREFRALRRGKY